MRRQTHPRTSSRTFEHRGKSQQWSLHSTRHGRIRVAAATQTLRNPCPRGGRYKSCFKKQGRSVPSACTHGRASRAATAKSCCALDCLLDPCPIHAWQTPDPRPIHAPSTVDPQLIHTPDPRHRSTPPIHTPDLHYVHGVHMPCLVCRRIHPDSSGILRAPSDVAGQAQEVSAIINEAYARLRLRRSALQSVE